MHDGTGHSEPRYTRDELVDELGISPEFAQKLWNAVGFPHRTTSEKIFSDADLQSVRLFIGDGAKMPEDTQLATARAIAQTMSRLADWQAERLLEFDRDPDIPWSIPEMIEALGKLQHLVWRRHLALALARDADHDVDDRPDTVVGFADIVGYTSLSRRIDHAELEALLTSFEERTHEIVTGLDGYVIKTLGDAVMFTFDDPRSAAMASVGIHRLSETPPIPPLRVGLARGPVLTRLGDIFGEPVNIAARLCGSARAGTTLADESVADALADDPRFRLKSIGPLHVRGYKRLRARVLEINRRAPVSPEIYTLAGEDATP